VAVQLVVNVDDPADLLVGYGAGAKVRLERATDAAFTTPTEIATQTILANQTQYEFWDTSGTVDSYYRSRYSDSAGTSFSSYSDVFRGGEVQAYATVDALRELLRLPDDSRDNQLTDLLLRVTTKITTSLGFDFFRHPAVSGTEVRLFDGDNGNMVRVPEGIISLTGVGLAAYTGQSYTALTVGDWRLRWPVKLGGPYLSVMLSDVGTWRRWYRGFDTVQLTGVFGYPSIPPDIEQATLMWAADLYRLGAGGGAQLSATGEEFGQERFAGGMPRFTWETVEDYRKRHQGPLVA
jgi:hypothetical protein